MTFFCDYLLKISICLFTAYSMYWLLLKRLTFHTWKRYYLAGMTIISFVVPLIDISSITALHHSGSGNMIGYIPSIDMYIHSGTAPTLNAQDHGMEGATLLFVFFVTGCSVFAAKLLVQLLSFHKMKNTAVLILELPVKVYRVDQPIIPFSFARSIFINPAMHNETEITEIIRHEFIHVKQKHSFDILLGELLVLVNWFNPFAWLIRKAIRENLEFIADEQVLQSGIDKKQYQYLLLRVTGIATFSIASKFNFSSLKKRIAMMNKNKSASLHLSRFLLVLPVIAVVLVAFRTYQDLPPALLPTIAKDTIPKPPPSAKAAGISEEIESMTISNGKATVRLKNGGNESYDLSNGDDRKAFEKKYGFLPKPPPPPMPPKPPAPDKAIPKPPPPPQPPADDGTISTVIAGKSITTVAGGTIPFTAPVKASAITSVKVEPAIAVTKTVTSKPIVVAGVEKVSTTITGVKPSVTISGVGSTQVISDKAEVLCKITSYTTREQLNDLQLQLKTRGYILKVEDVHINNNKIESINASISYKGKTSHFSASDFKMIVVMAYAKEKDKKEINIYVENGNITVEKD